MELRQLKYFVKVAKTKSFSAAAREMNLSQSAFSQQIQLLEAELQVKLFVRSTRNVQLTEVGEELLPMVRRILEDTSACLDTVQNSRTLRTGVLNIGCTYTFRPLLDDAVLTFMQRYPGVLLNMHVRPMEVLMDELCHHDLDIALSYRPLKPYPDVVSHVLFDNHLAAVMSDTHPLSHHNTIHLQALQHWQLALPIAGMQARDVLDTLLSNSQIQYHVRMQSNNVDVLLALAHRSHVVTFFSQATVSRTSGLVAIPLADVLPTMEGCYHVLKDQYQKRATREFVKILSEIKLFSINKIIAD